MFKIRVFFFFNNSVRPVINDGCHLLTCGKHLHDNVISLRMEVRVNKTSLTPPSFIEISVPSTWAVIYVCKGLRGIDFVSFLRFFLEILELFGQRGMLCFSFITTGNYKHILFVKQYAHHVLFTEIC